MPGSAASHQIGGRLGRPDQVEDIAGLDCGRLSSHQTALRTYEEVAIERVHSRGEPGPFQKTPCNAAQRKLLLKLLAEEEAREPAPEKELRPPLQSPDDRDRR